MKLIEFKQRPWLFRITAASGLYALDGFPNRLRIRGVGERQIAVDRGIVGPQAPRLLKQFDGARNPALKAVEVAQVGSGAVAGWVAFERALQNGGRLLTKWEHQIRREFGGCGVLGGCLIEMFCFLERKRIVVANQGTLLRWYREGIHQNHVDG